MAFAGALTTQLAVSPGPCSLLLTPFQATVLPLCSAQWKLKYLLLAWVAVLSVPAEVASPGPIHESSVTVYFIIHYRDSLRVCRGGQTIGFNA